MNNKMIILFPFHRVEKNSRIIIYGAGDIGQSFYWELKNTKYAQVVGWIDQSWADEVDLEMPKMRLGQLNELIYDYVVIALRNKETSLEVYHDLLIQGASSEKIIIDDYVIHYPAVNYKKIFEKNKISEDKTGKKIRKSICIRIGFLAAGKIAHTMAKTIMEKCEDIRLYAVASRDREKAENFKSLYGFEKAYDSYEELLEDKNVDFVYISSPAAFHYKHTQMALRMGKHVLCEKPFAVNYRQAEEMIKEAEKRSLFISDGLWVAYLPLIQDIREVLKEGLIGKISTVAADQHYNSLYNPRLTDYKLCGGAFLEAGFYLLYYVKLILGADIQKTYAVSCINENGIDLQESIVLQYPDAFACISSGMISSSPRAGYAFGEKGYMYIADANEYKELKVYLSSGELIRSIRKETGYQYELQACAEAICAGSLETKERPHEEILEELKWMDAIRRQMGVRYAIDEQEEL